jgi:hypothetical protein
MALASSVALLAACGTTKPLVIAADAVGDVPEAPSCGLTMVLLDKRPSSHLGLIGAREFVYPDYLAFLERQLAMRFAGRESAPSHQVELLRAYLETNRTTLSFNTVVRVRKPGESDQEARVYRGDTTKINWAGGDSELGAYIERSTEALLDTMAQGEGCRA